MHEVVLLFYHASIFNILLFYLTIFAFVALLCAFLIKYQDYPQRMSGKAVSEDYTPLSTLSISTSPGNTSCDPPKPVSHHDLSRCKSGQLESFPGLTLKLEEKWPPGSPCRKNVVWGYSNHLPCLGEDIFIGECATR